MPHNPKYIEEYQKEVRKSQKDTFGWSDNYWLDDRQLEWLDTKISQALEYGYTQGKKETVEEVVREIEKTIQDDRFAGAPYALNSLKDKLLAKGNKDEHN